MSSFHPERNTPTWRENIQALLENRDVTIVFQKVDGSMRTIEATLQKNIVPVTKGLRPKNSEILTVYDAQICEWRSVKWDRIVSAKW